jgi:hypothetical protein
VARVLRRGCALACAHTDDITTDFHGTLRHPKTRKPLAKSAIHRGALTASVGFPYGYDAADNSIVSSGFSGHIVGSQIYSRLPGRPLVFELSFAAPRDLSGAPLLYGGQICGVVFANHQTKMLMFTDEERIEERSGTTRIERVERYEALNLGLAVSAPTILSLHLPDGQSLLDFVLATGVEVHNRD